MPAALALLLIATGAPAAGAVEDQVPAVSEEDLQRMEAQLDAVLEEQGRILESLERVIEEAKIVKIRASRRRP